MNRTQQKINFATAFNFYAVVTGIVVYISVSLMALFLLSVALFSAIHFVVCVVFAFIAGWFAYHDFYIIHLMKKYCSYLNTIDDRRYDRDLNQTAAGGET